MQYFTQETFQFLNEIRANNNREWFEENKSRYEKIRKQLSKFAHDLMDHVMMFDESLRDGEQPYLFRIYRDARYSKGIPYKTNLGILLLKGGRPAMCERAGYYIHIEPGNSFFGGGAHMPTPKWLSAIRDEIVAKPQKIKEILNDSKLQKNFYLEGDQLKTVPRGYPKDHPEIELLRYKGFSAWHPLSDKQILSETLVDDLATSFQSLYPLNEWLNKCRLKAG